MAIRGFNESSLANSEMYQQYKTNTKDDPVERARKLIANARQLTNADIESAYISIKRYTSSLSREALKAYDSGDIVLLYQTDPRLSMTQMIPFMVLRKGDRYQAYIFMDRWVTKPKRPTDDLIVNPEKLHDLLVGALIARALKMNYRALTSSAYLERTLMSLYTSFFWRILNREFMIGADRILADTVKYFVNRFFLTRIFSSVSDQAGIENLAKSHFREVDELKYGQLREDYDRVDPVNLSELLKLISGLAPRLEPLTTKMFVNDWSNYYLYTAIMALDNIEYLIFMVYTLKNANNIVNNLASDIVRETKNIKNFEEELLKLISH